MGSSQLRTQGNGPSAYAAGLVREASSWPKNIIGNYRLVKCILTGQHSQVWEVVETSSHRHFAMKLLLPERAADPDATEDALSRGESRHGVDASQRHPHRLRQRGKDQSLFRDGVFPGRQPEGRGCATSNSISSASARTASSSRRRPGWRTSTPAAGCIATSSRTTCSSTARGSCGSSTSPSPSESRRRVFSPSCSAARRRCRGRAATCRRSRFAARCSMAGPTFTAFGATLYELTTYRPPFRAATQQDLLQKHIIGKAGAADLAHART